MYFGCIWKQKQSTPFWLSYIAFELSFDLRQFEKDDFNILETDFDKNILLFWVKKAMNVANKSP